MDIFNIGFDNNIWNYLVDNDQVEIVRKHARLHSVSIVAIPAVAYETLRDGDDQRRKKRISAITRRSWKRLMPEAFEISEELRAEISRNRPGWLLQHADMTSWYKLRADWQGAWWERARRSPGLEARYIDQLGGAQLAAAREETEELRREARQAGLHLEHLDLQVEHALFGEPVPGWNGRPFEPWRAEGMMYWWNNLFGRENSAEREWLGPWLHLPRLQRDQEGWIQFWTAEVEASRLARHWIRWAFGRAQALRGWTQGVPVVDNQISAYLFDLDLFATSDKNFVACLDAIRPHAPRPICAVLRVPGGASCGPALIEAMEQATG